MRSSSWSTTCIWSPVRRGAGWQAAAETGARTYGEGAAASAVVLGEPARLAARGQPEVPIARTFPLEQVRDAFRELERQHTHGKIVLLPWPQLSEATNEQATTPTPGSLGVRRPRHAGQETEPINGWITGHNLRVFLQLLSRYVGYAFDRTDWEAIEAGVQDTDDEAPGGWYSYPLVGASAALEVALARAVGGEENR